MSTGLSIRRTARRIPRDEKARITREGLIAAGCKVVAAEGYAPATIAKIADAAGVAHGTFYNYFEDRQALFEELLPYEGKRMLAAIEKAAIDARPGIARELVRFNTFLDYVAESEGFYRVLYEAEVFAPNAHRIHIDTIVSGYRRSLRRGVEEGHVAELTDAEIDSVIYHLLGMRAYAAMQIHYEKNPDARKRIIENSMRIYDRILRMSLLMK
ncbi:MAG: TetR/AcrR family transcriptional regulator [Pseudomonas sp.]